jgi:hypothetical protein
MRHFDELDKGSHGHGLSLGLINGNGGVLASRELLT